MIPYARVKVSRERTAETFPFPALRPSLDYTVCEFAGELRDAMLRDERGGDVRNNDKAHSQRAELGDAFYMLLSACIRANHAPDAYQVVAWTTRRRCNEILRMLTFAADHAARLDGETPSRDFARESACARMDNAYNNMVALAHAHGWDVDALVDDACTKFERKYAPVEVR